MTELEAELARILDQRETLQDECPFGHRMWWFDDRRDPRDGRCGGRWGICVGEQSRCKYVWLFGNWDLARPDRPWKWSQLKDFDPARLVSRLKEVAKALGYFETR